MSSNPPAESEPAPARTRRRVMHCVRRGHLYLGLFLLPWAILYGVTGFLFNHPAAFPDAPTATFTRADLAGTPMEYPPAPAAVAEQVVAALNDRAEGKPYSLVSPEKARYTRSSRSPRSRPTASRSVCCSTRRARAARCGRARSCRRRWRSARRSRSARG